MQIKFENRYKGDCGRSCLLSVDGTHFRIQHRGREYYSHKFNDSGLSYEVAVSINSGDICWLNGPFPAGTPDIEIFRKGLMTELEEYECCEADDGYIGEHPHHIKCPGGMFTDPERLEVMQRVRSRQETANKRFKNWAILNQKFRNCLSLHADAFRAIVVITQLTIEQGEGLFQVMGY